MRPPFPLQDVSIRLIDLDLRNSRFPRDAQSQADAFDLMLTTAGDDCMDMLRDLTRTGQMNSSDIPIVISQDGRYIMMEGNRRLTCLRLWTDPTLLRQDEALEKQYLSRVERLIEDSAYAPPTEIRVAVAPNEADANVWIERKHTGGSGGAGTVAWGAAMKDRRRARKDPTKASRAMAFVELVSGEYSEEPDIMAALDTVRNDRYTFIQRFVDRSVVRDMIGLDFRQGKMAFRHGAELSLPIIRQVLSDFAQPKAESGRTWARELDTVEDFREYLRKYLHLLPDKSLPEAKSEGDDKNDGNSGRPTPPPRGGQNDKANGRQAEQKGQSDGIKNTDGDDPRPGRGVRRLRRRRAVGGGARLVPREHRRRTECALRRSGPAARDPR